MTRPGILLVYGNVGGGHKTPAKALEAAIRSRFGDSVHVEAIDLFAHADPMVLSSSDSSHGLFSRYMVLRFISDCLWHLFNSRPANHVLNWFLILRTARKYRYVMAEKMPHVVVSLHPFTTVVVRHLKPRMTHYRSAVVITDLVSLLRGWFDPTADLVVSPTRDATRTLLKNGIDSARIMTGYYALPPGLTRYRPRHEVLAELGLSPYRNCVLITGGGVGAGSLRGAIDVVAGMDGVQLIVLCGRDTRLMHHLEEQYRGKKGFAVLGFVHNIQDYLGASDIVVAKPGSASIMELEALNKSAIFTGPVGPQEAGNIQYIARNRRFSYIGNNWGALPEAIEHGFSQNRNQLAPRRSIGETYAMADGIVGLCGAEPIGAISAEPGET